jgi:hypothetical protein
MIEVGSQIRAELNLDEEEGANIVDSDGTLHNQHQLKKYFYKDRSCAPFQNKNYEH